MIKDKLYRQNLPPPHDSPCRHRSLKNKTMQKKSRINWYIVVAIIIVIIFSGVMAFKYFSKPKVTAETNPLSVCDAFPGDNYYTLTCYVRFAIRNNDPSVCDRLEGKDALSCNEIVKTDVGYLDKNNIYINPTKWGDVKILTPKAGEILDKSKNYKITWATDTFSDKDAICRLIISEYYRGAITGASITDGCISAKQGYYNLTPSSIEGFSSGKKYFIYLDAGHEPNDDNLKLHGTGDLFEFK